MNLADRTMETGLRALRSLAGMEAIDRAGLRDLTERLIYHGTRNGFVAANTAARSFKAAQKLTSPKRQPAVRPKRLFDLTPTDEQQFMVESFGEFAAKELRPAASEADADCAAPVPLLEQAGQLGVTTVGVPSELGGAVEERSAVTSVLISEALAHGDMGLAVAALAPAGPSTAISLWGDADQQATYLPAFTAEEPPAAALAVLEPRPLFDPFELQTKARRDGDGFVLDGIKSLVPRAHSSELFVVAAELDGPGPALFLVEATNEGVMVEPAPAMGVRAAATGTLKLDGVRLGASALLGEGSPAVYSECVQLSRLAWCAVTTGTARATLDYVSTYVNERTAFGEPISHRQAVAFCVADMAIEVEGMRLTTLRAASLVDQGKDFSRETAIARRLCAGKGSTIGSEGVQMLGGHGYTKEHPVERWFRDLRAAGVMEGGLLV